MRCKACQRFPQPPARFNVTIPTEESLVFGDELSVDLMFLEGKAVCNVADTGTRFSAEKFLDAHEKNYGQYYNGIWLAFVMSWCLGYTGYSDILRTGQEFSFTLDSWKQLADTNGVSYSFLELKLTAL